MKHKIIPIAVISLLLGIAFDYLFYGKVPGISVPIYTALILGFTLYLAESFRIRLSSSTKAIMLVTLFFALMVFIRASPLLVFFNIVLVMYLLLLTVRLGIQPALQLYQLNADNYLRRIFRLPLRFLHEAAMALGRALSSRQASRVTGSSTAAYVRGIALSIPILAIFLLLLSSADVVFKQYVGDLLDIRIDNPVLIFRLLLVFLVASLFVGAYALLFIQPPVDTSQDLATTPNLRLGAVEGTIVLGSVCLLFFVFLLVQVTYLFGDSNQIISGGYTYAEYARKGFSELIVVALISLLLILGVKKSLTEQTTKQYNVVKWLSVVLIFEVMIIMLSAHQRLSLYETAYGFTILRLLSHLFILWLAVAFILLLIYIVRKQQAQQFACSIFVSIVAFFAVLNLINPDALIARQNIQRLETTGKIDLNYLNSLSADATPIVAKLLDNPDANLSRGTASLLYQKQQNAKSQNLPWQSTNVARSAERQILSDKNDLLEANKTYIYVAPDM